MDTKKTRVVARDLDTKEVADLLGCSPRAVRIWARKGLLRGRLVLGFVWQFRPQDVARFVKPVRGRPKGKGRKPALNGSANS